MDEGKSIALSRAIFTLFIANFLDTFSGSSPLLASWGLFQQMLAPYFVTHKRRMNLHLEIAYSFAFIDVQLDILKTSRLFILPIN